MTKKAVRGRVLTALAIVFLASMSAPAAMAAEAAPGRPQANVASTTAAYGPAVACEVDFYVNYVKSMDDYWF